LSTLIPYYPRALGFGTVVGSRSLEGRCTWQRYWANSVDVPGPTTEALGKIARQTGTYAVQFRLHIFSPTHLSTLVQSFENTATLHYGRTSKYLAGVVP
jgi:hypothetical protein